MNDQPCRQTRCHQTGFHLPLWLIVLLGACGGDSGHDDLPGAAQLRAQEAAAPMVSGDVATDGLTWFNFRRQQAGLPLLLRDPVLDAAASAHSNYQLINQITPLPSKFDNFQ